MDIKRACNPSDEQVFDFVNRHPEVISSKFKANAVERTKQLAETNTDNLIIQKE